MNKQQAIMLYEGDEWLSTSSLVCMGVFTNQRKLQKAIRKHVKQLLQRRLLFEEKYGDYETERDAVAYVCQQITEKGQYCGYSASICIKRIELNQFEEI